MRSLKTLIAVALTVLAGTASAHPGHGDGLAAGLAHPLLGADHLFAMLAVGLWSAAALPQGERRSGPAIFLGMLALGAVLGSNGLALPMLEPLLALTLLVLAAMIGGAARLPVAPGLALVGLAGALHGMAHGAELPMGHPFLAYAAGFLATSATLHVAGLWLARHVIGAQLWRWRMAAAGLGLGGVALLIGRA